MEGAKTTAKEQEHTALLRTIIDESLLIRRLLQHKKEPTEDLIQYLLIHTVKKVYSSGQVPDAFVGNMLAPCMEKLLQVGTEVCNPASLPKYFQSNINQQYSPDEMFMFRPVHSGTTTGPIGMAQEYKWLNIPVVRIIIDSNSPLASLPDIITNKLCGSEESFIKTRTHMASLLITLLCIIETVNQKEFTSRQQHTYYRQYFIRLEDNVNQITKDTVDWYENRRELLQTKMVVRYIRVDPYYIVAREGGLKIAETASIAVLAYEQEEFMHTGTTQIQKDTLLFLIAPDDVQEMRMPELIRWRRLYSNYITPIIDHSHPLKDSKVLLRHFQDGPYCNVMEYIVPLQMFVHLLAEDRDLSVVHAANNGASAYLKTYTEGV